MTLNTAYALHEVIKAVQGKPVGAVSDKVRIRFLLLDSRQLIAPEHTLFFAIKTNKNDGHLYIEELLRKGVRNFIVEVAEKNWINNFPDACFIQHEDPLTALQLLARHHRRKNNPKVIGITGSNGKTIVKEWLHQLLYDEKQIVRSPKSYNSQIGVPLSVWLIEPQHELGIFEAGISRPGEMDKLQQILDPHVGIFTNIGSAHDEGFISRTQKIEEKLNLFHSCRALIYCCDQQNVHLAVQEWHKKHKHVQLFTWGFEMDATLQIINVEKADNQTLIAARYRGKRFLISIPFLDDASIENTLHCLAYLKYAGYADAKIIPRFSKLQPVAMRLEMKEGLNDSIVINDSYNSDLQSLAIALDFLGNQARHKRKTLILSDILQSGVEPEILYSRVADLVRSHNIQRFIGIGPEIESQSHLFSESSLFFNDTEAFVSDFDLHTLQKEAILLKGARVFGFERLSNLLQQKDHQTILEINLDALIHNLNVFRSMLRPGTKTMCMVKAFSYGSGTVEVARMLQFHQVDYLAVAYADEGKILREGGVDMPIVVMNPEIRTFETLFEFRLEPEIYGFPLLKKLIRALAQETVHEKPISFPIHVKLDTGMHRLGFMPDDAEPLIDLLKANPHICVASVFSHLAASEDSGQDPFTRMQIELFQRLCDAIQNALGYPFLRHIANSSAISRFPEAHFDMVRPGIGLYGVSGDPAVQQLLQHVSTFRSVVSQIKTVPKGVSVGYGRSARTDREMKLAIVPVGYADGLNRRLSDGRGKLLVHGEKVPIVGKISMDMCAVDVTDLDVKEGDEVIIFGKELPATEMAKDLETIPYEIFTSVSQRVKRVYYQE